MDNSKRFNRTRALQSAPAGMRAYQKCTLRYLTVKKREPLRPNP